MSLPQIEAVLEACCRREADNALTALRTVNTAAVPLIAGREGWEAYKQLQNELLAVRDGPKTAVASEADAFAKMLTEARENQRTGLA